MAIDYKKRCSFCGKNKEGTHKFLSGTTGKLVCFECISFLKETLADIRSMRMSKEKPDESQRCD